MVAILMTTFSLTFSGKKISYCDENYTTYSISFLLTICHHRFRQWLGTEQATSHWLDQWWTSALTRMCHQGVVSILRCRLTSIGITMLKIRRSHDRLIFNIGIPIPRKDGPYIATGPRPLSDQVNISTHNQLVTHGCVINTAATAVRSGAKSPDHHYQQCWLP